jgi:type II secretory pathway pseudopilin PulG
VLARASFLGARLRRALADEGGFGLIELLVAMLVLAVGIGALITVFATSVISLSNAGHRGTALTLSDKQLEVYRTLPFTSIRIDGSQLPASGTYVTTWQTDCTITDLPAGCSPPALTTQALAGQNGDSACSGSVAFPDPCAPVQTVTGADNHRYRIDTYVEYTDNNATLSIATPASGLSLKRVVVLARDATKGIVLARGSSVFQRPS